MATVKMLNLQGKDAGTVELSPAVFEKKPNPALIHQAVIAEMTWWRQGTHKVKTRAEVSGGGRKPYRQKGTGRARQGSIRSPHFRHGGVVHGPVPRDHSVKLNNKMHIAAIRSALSSRLPDKLIVVDSLRIESGKTRDMVAALKALNANGKILILVNEFNEETILAMRNLPNVDISGPFELSVYDVLNANIIIASQEAVEAIGEVYA